MSIVCFYNSGALDHRAFTMMGLSAKDNEKAIGFFGTGFKYAIATLLRNECQVEIRVRNEVEHRPTCPSMYSVHSADYDQCNCTREYTLYTFYTKPYRFRDKHVDLIYCLNSSTGLEIELPYTMHLGANWQVWQAYRELYTNCVIDEKGGVLMLEEGEVHDADVCVYVHGADFIRVHEQHDKYFIPADAIEIGQSYMLRAVEKQPDSDNVVYYKTMYTGTRLDKPTLFTYDYIDAVTLTEDRTLNDTWGIRGHISNLWVECLPYDALIENLPLVAKDGFYEYGLSYDYSSPSDDFKRACGYLIEHHRPIPLWAHSIYSKSRPFGEQVAKYKLNKFHKRQLQKAVKVMHHHDMMIVIDEIIPCVSLPNDVMGMVRDGFIYIAKDCFERGHHMLLGTLYEEYLHQTTGCADGTRKMQNMLIDRISLLMDQVYMMEQED